MVKHLQLRSTENEYVQGAREKEEKELKHAQNARDKE